MGIIGMTGGWIGIGYLAIPMGIWIWHGIGAWIRINPVAARAVDINVGIVAPSVAVVLKNVPAGNIGKEPSLVPAGAVDISCILSIEHAAWIPLIKPDVA